MNNIIVWMAVVFVSYSRILFATDNCGIYVYIILFTQKNASDAVYECCFICWKHLLCKQSTIFYAFNYKKLSWRMKLPQTNFPAHIGYWNWEIDMLFRLQIIFVATCCVKYWRELNNNIHNYKCSSRKNIGLNIFTIYLYIYIYIRSGFLFNHIVHNILIYEYNMNKY